MINIRKLEKELWESADLLRQGSKLTSNEYCMPVLGLIFLRYAFVRFKAVETEIMKNRPMRHGVALPASPEDFKTKSALFLPKEAQYDYLLTLPDDEDIGKAVNHAMELLEAQSAQLAGILPKTYDSFKDDLLRDLLRIFNNQTLSEVGGDVIGRIYEYFLSKFAPAVASDDGVFFTPKSLVQMLVNVTEPERGILLDPACGSGGMFVQTGYFVEMQGKNANSVMIFYGHEKVEYNARLCLMNMAVHGLNGRIISGDEANTFYNDAHNLEGRCDYVMANPPFNVDKVKSESALNAGRLPFGLPGVNAQKEVSNANYLWVEYFYAYLNETGRAGFVMASSASDSGNKDREIRRQLLESKAVDVMFSVSNNFFYTKSLPCSLWFFDKAKKEEIKDKVLFIDARKYYRIVDRTLNDWSEWQLKNLNAIVWLYRGEKEKYAALLDNYLQTICSYASDFSSVFDTNQNIFWLIDNEDWTAQAKSIMEKLSLIYTVFDSYPVRELLKGFIASTNQMLKETLQYITDTDNFLDLKTSASCPPELAEEYHNSSKLKRKLNERCQGLIDFIKEFNEVIKQAKWLTDKFSEGVYNDVLGLCKVASLGEIKEKNYSLTPGAYVGVAPVVDVDADNFAERMTEIHNELRTLQAESNELMDKITANFEGLVL